MYYFFKNSEKCLYLKYTHFTRFLHTLSKKYFYKFIIFENSSIKFLLIKIYSKYSNQKIFEYLLMGHKDITITLNTYTSVFDKFKEKEIDKVNKYYLEENMLKAVKLLQEENDILDNTENIIY